jgi:hypothetical protein
MDIIAFYNELTCKNIFTGHLSILLDIYPFYWTFIHSTGQLFILLEKVKLCYWTKTLSYRTFE